jgi:MFS family permease
VLAGILPLTTLVSAPLWGELADATKSSRNVLLTALAASLVPVRFIAQSTTFGWLALAVLLFAFVFAPVMPLADNAVLEVMEVARRRRH